MVKQADSSSKPAAARKKRSGAGGASPRRRSGVVGKSGLRSEPEFSTSAKRALLVRRFLLFLLTVVLLTIGILSVCGVRFF